MPDTLMLLPTLRVYVELVPFVWFVPFVIDVVAVVVAAVVVSVVVAIRLVVEAVSSMSDREDDADVSISLSGTVTAPWLITYNVPAIMPSTRMRIMNRLVICLNML